MILYFGSFLILIFIIHYNEIIIKFIHFLETLQIKQDNLQLVLICANLLLILSIVKLLFTVLSLSINNSKSLRQ